MCSVVCVPRGRAEGEGRVSMGDPGPHAEQQAGLEGGMWDHGPV